MKHGSRFTRWIFATTIGLSAALGVSACGETSPDEQVVGDLEGDVAGTVATPPTTPGPATAAGDAGPSAEEQPASLPVSLVVDVSDRMLYAYLDGERVERYPVAVGEPDHPTPKGKFEIDRIIWNPAWVPPPNAEWAEDNERKDPNEEDNPMVGAKLFFKYPDYYIHGTDATHTLGEAESHGCIRMDPSDVKRLAEWVQEHAGKDRGEQWFDRVKKNDESKHEISLPDPVPLDVHT